MRGGVFMFNKLKKFLRSKRALANVSTAIKVGTSVVLGALLLVGSYGIIKTTVLPKTNHKVSDMYNQEFADSNGTWSSPDSIEELKAKYNFKYYSTLELAVADVNASTPGANADALELVAEAGLYEKEDGSSCVVLLKDSNKTETITFSNDIELNLGGHTLSFDGVTNALSSTSGDYSILINGNLSGSTINASAGTGVIRTIRAQYNTWNISGGTYTATGSKAVYGLVAAGNCNLTNCSILVSGTGGSVFGIITSGANISVKNSSINVSCSCTNEETTAAGIQLQKTNELNMLDCYIQVDARTNLAAGINILNTSTCVINAKRTSLNAYNDYITDNGHYRHYSYGMLSTSATSVINLENCEVYGTHSGVTSLSTLNVDGGTYSGFGHGGFYLGENSIIKNATIKEAGMPVGYSNTANNSNHSAIYIGEGSNKNIYVDNCRLFADNTNSSNGRTIVLRNTSGETNNKLYISNSVLDKNTLRIDAGNKVYIGVGNNFTASDTSNASACEVTSETYN